MVRRPLTRESEAAEHSPKRTLTSLDLTMLGIGAIIGTGIFAAIGTATAGKPDRPGAGPAIILSFVLTAIACVFSALCCAEFAAMIPLPAAPTPTPRWGRWSRGPAVGNIAVAISWGSHRNAFTFGRVACVHPRC